MTLTQVLFEVKCRPAVCAQNSRYRRERWPADAFIDFGVHPTKTVPFYGYSKEGPSFAKPYMPKLCDFWAADWEPYQPRPDRELMGFGAALEKIKAGKRVARMPWRCGVWIAIESGTIVMHDPTRAVPGERDWPVYPKELLADDWYEVQTFGPPLPECF